MWDDQDVSCLWGSLISSCRLNPRVFSFHELHGWDCIECWAEVNKQHPGVAVLSWCAEGNIWHTSLVIGVAVQIQSLLMHFLKPVFRVFLAMLYTSLSPDWKFICFDLDRALISPFIQNFWLGNTLTFVVITMSSTHLLIYEVTENTLFSHNFKTTCLMLSGFSLYRWQRWSVCCPEWHHRGPILEPGLGMGLEGKRLVAGSLPKGPGWERPERATWARPHVGPPPAGGFRSDLVWFGWQSVVGALMTQYPEVDSSHGDMECHLAGKARALERQEWQESVGVHPGEREGRFPAPSGLE